jgi:hypothetical protein
LLPAILPVQFFYPPPKPFCTEMLTPLWRCRVTIVVCVTNVSYITNINNKQCICTPF